MEKIQFSEIEISRLRDSDSDELSHFFCGNDILDGFFHQEVYYCHNCHFLTAYCVRYRGRLIAAFTLANDSLSIESDDIDSVQQEVSEDAPTDKLSFYHRYFEVTNDFPAVNIGHLAVDKDFQSKGIVNQFEQTLEAFVNSPESRTDLKEVTSTIESNKLQRVVQRGEV